MFWKNFQKDWRPPQALNFRRFDFSFMSWKNKAFDDFKLYAVTDAQEESAGILKKIDRAYAGGVDMIQLRSKTLSDAALYRLGMKVRRIADKRQKLFFINDRPDLAVLLEADGVHLGQEDLSVIAVRRFLKNAGKHLWIGKSTHDLQQARRAAREGANYIGVGPIFATPTKPGYPATGLNFIRQAIHSIRIPFVAIGGIDLSNIDEVLQAGARRIAVVRAVFSEDDPYDAAEKLKDKIQSYWSCWQK